MNIAQRKHAFAENYAPTWIDRFGVWLSARQIHNWVPTFKGKAIGDFGCGYHASFTRTVLDEVNSATLLDVSVSSELKAHSKVLAIEGNLLSRKY